jgi:hypothetical protein
MNTNTYITTNPPVVVNKKFKRFKRRHQSPSTSTTTTTLPQITSSDNGGSSILESKNKNSIIIDHHHRPFICNVGLFGFEGKCYREVENKNKNFDPNTNLQPRFATLEECQNKCRNFSNSVLPLTYDILNYASFNRDRNNPVIQTQEGKGEGEPKDSNFLSDYLNEYDQYISNILKFSQTNIPQAQKIYFIFLELQKVMNEILNLTGSYSNHEDMSIERQNKLCYLIFGPLTKNIVRPFINTIYQFISDQIDYPRREGETLLRDLLKCIILNDDPNRIEDEEIDKLKYFLNYLSPENVYSFLLKTIESTSFNAKFPNFSKFYQILVKLKNDDYNFQTLLALFRSDDNNLYYIYQVVPDIKNWNIDRLNAINIFNLPDISSELYSTYNNLPQYFLNYLETFWWTVASIIKDGKIDVKDPQIAEFIKDIKTTAGLWLNKILNIRRQKDPNVWESVEVVQNYERIIDYLEEIIALRQ